MFTARTPPQNIDRLRLEAEYYDPAKLAALRWMETWRSRLVSLADLCDYITDGTHVTPSYVDSGVHFLSSTNINSCSISFDDTKFITPEEHASLGKAKCNPAPGDVLLAKNGKIGTAAVYRKHHPSCSLFVSVALLRDVRRLDRDYLAAFLNSSAGWNQFARSSKTGVITNLHLEEIREVSVPEPARAVQVYIGSKVRQADLLSQYCRGLVEAIGHHFQFLTDGYSSRPKAWRTQSHLLDSYRANPTHYDPVVLRMLSDAPKKVKLLELGSLLGQRGMSGGATPLGAVYGNAGVFFVRVQNVKPYRLDLSDAAYLSPDQDELLKRSRCAAEEVILSITGYPGTVSLVMEEDLPLNINQHCVRFDVRSPYDPAYVVAAMNCPFVKRQVERLAIGGTREALDYPSVYSLLVPMLDDRTMEAVADQVRTLNMADRSSKRLVTVAKILSEALVEGRVAECEIVEAQQAIDNGDYTADRQLLARLTQDGVDIDGSPKLIHDSDALYRTLNSAEGPSPLEAK